MARHKHSTLIWSKNEAAQPAKQKIIIIITGCNINHKTPMFWEGGALRYLHCSAALLFFLSLCSECVGSLILSLSWCVNGRWAIVSGASISMAKLFPLRGYFHWPNSIFPFALLQTLGRMRGACWFFFISPLTAMSYMLLGGLKK